MFLRYRVDYIWKGQIRDLQTYFTRLFFLRSYKFGLHRCWGSTSSRHISVLKDVSESKFRLISREVFASFSSEPCDIVHLWARGALPPLIFRLNWGKKGRKKFFIPPPPPHPLISGSGWTGSPPLSEHLYPPLLYLAWFTYLPKIATESEKTPKRPLFCSLKAENHFWFKTAEINNGI